MSIDDFQYDKLTEMRDGLLDQKCKWKWITHDDGAWDGPIKDWRSHQHVFYKYVRNFDVVVTAGANQGLYTWAHAQRFKNVYSFEPDQLNFHCMVNNCQLDNVFKFNCALGATNHFATLNYSRHNTNTGTFSMEKKPGNVPVLSIDSFNFPSLDLIQLDIEGGEYDAIVGAEQSIWNFKPVIVVENGQTANIIEIMKNFKYTLKDCSAADSIWVPEM